MGFNHEHVDLPNEMSVALGTCCCFNNFMPWSLILLVKYTTASGKKRISPTKNGYDEMWINRCSKHAPSGVTTHPGPDAGWSSQERTPVKSATKEVTNLKTTCIYIYIYYRYVCMYISIFICTANSMGTNMMTSWPQWIDFSENTWKSESLVFTNKFLVELFLGSINCHGSYCVSFASQLLSQLEGDRTRGRHTGLSSYCPWKLLFWSCAQFSD